MLILEDIPAPRARMQCNVWSFDFINTLGWSSFRYIQLVSNQISGHQNSDNLEKTSNSSIIFQLFRLNEGTEITEFHPYLSRNSKFSQIQWLLQFTKFPYNTKQSRQKLINLYKTYKVLK